MFKEKKQTRTTFQSQKLDFSPKLVPLHFGALWSTFDSFNFGKKRCNTSQDFGPFFV